MSIKKESDSKSKLVASKQKTKKEDNIVIQLKAKKIDIFRVSKILVRFSIKTSISDSEITLEGDISDISEELLAKLCEEIECLSIQNFKSERQLEIFEKDSAENEYDLIYSEVKRGEVYICDFGDPYGREQGFVRYAIVIQNDVANLKSKTTIVVPCTTARRKLLPVHISCTFSTENMLDYDEKIVGTKQNIIQTEQIRTIDKTRLRKYLGTLTPDFMQEIQDKIEISLQFNDGTENQLNNSSKVNVSQSDNRRLSEVQLELLSNVNIKTFARIAKSDDSINDKVKKILLMFAFDLNKRGVQYLEEAIIVSQTDKHHNLESLSEIIANGNNIDKEEVKRLIIARVKERFRTKKSPAIDFIRLINIFLNN